MKRIPIYLLVIVMLLSVMAVADSPDPIVVQWYLLYDFSVYPEFSSIYEGSYDFVIGVYSFLADGTIMELSVGVDDGEGTPEYSPIGKWEKQGNKYKYSMAGLGQNNDAVIKDDVLLLKLTDNNGIYMTLRKMIPFNFYQDYVR